MYQFVRNFDEKLANKLLPYAAITTISDVSNLNYENRIIVANGLKQFNQIKNIGLKELMAISEIDDKNCSVTDVSFKLAPRINANGRIKHAEIVLQLLDVKNDDDAFKLALEIDGINKKRKELQSKMSNQAFEQLIDFNGVGIALYNKNWKPGIVGIVASKVSEKYRVPTIIFGQNEDKIKGSARSVNGINVKEIMDTIEHVFEQYGGHEMAAGATLKEEYATIIHEVFNEAVKNYKEKNGITNAIMYYDIKLKHETFFKINDSFCNSLDRFKPFGSGNEPFTFLVENIHCEKVKEWGSGNGAFLTIEGLDMDCFFYENNASEKLYNKNFDMLFQINENFKDDVQWALIVKDYKIR